MPDVSITSIDGSIIISINAPSAQQTTKFPSSIAPAFSTSKTSITAAAVIPANISSVVRYHVTVKNRT